MAGLNWAFSPESYTPRLSGICNAAPNGIEFAIQYFSRVLNSSPRRGRLFQPEASPWAYKRYLIIRPEGANHFTPKASPQADQHDPDNSPRRGRLLHPEASPWVKRHQTHLRPVRATQDDVIITFSGFWPLAFSFWKSKRSRRLRRLSRLAQK